MLFEHFPASLAAAVLTPNVQPHTEAGAADLFADHLHCLEQPEKQAEKATARVAENQTLGLLLEDPGGPLKPYLPENFLRQRQ